MGLIFVGFAGPRKLQLLLFTLYNFYIAMQLSEFMASRASDTIFAVSSEKPDFCLATVCLLIFKSLTFINQAEYHMNMFNQLPLITVNREYQVYEISPL